MPRPSVTQPQAPDSPKAASRNPHREFLLGVSGVSFFGHGSSPLMVIYNFNLIRVAVQSLISNYTKCVCFMLKVKDNTPCTGGENMNGPCIVLDIPADVVAAVKLPPQEIEQEFRKELALALYKRGTLSFGKARVLAHLSYWEFSELLGNRQIARHYTEADLDEDILYALGNK
jgi:predicted HTH domain antitoxin